MIDLDVHVEGVVEVNGVDWMKSLCMSSVTPPQDTRGLDRDHWLGAEVCVLGR